MKVLLLLALFVCGCSSQEKRTFNTDQPSAPAPNTITTNGESPRALSTSNEKISPVFFPETYEYLAIVEVIKGTATGISKILENPKQSPNLDGSCYYGEANQQALSSPCKRIQVNLLDEGNQITASTYTDENGNFRFYIPSGKIYYVQVIDLKKRTAVIHKKVGRSDYVTMFIKP